MSVSVVTGKQQLTLTFRACLLFGEMKVCVHITLNFLAVNYKIYTDKLSYVVSSCPRKTILHYASYLVPLTIAHLVYSLFVVKSKELHGIEYKEKRQTSSCRNLIIL